MQVVHCGLQSYCFLRKINYGSDNAKVLGSDSTRVIVIVYSAFKLLKPLYTFGTENKIKVHRFTNNFLTGFTEGNGERLLLKYYSMKCFTF